MKRSRQPWKPDYQTSRRPSGQSPLRQRASELKPNRLRETFISLIAENDGEVLCKLLETSAGTDR